MIHCKLYRYYGHFEGDATTYRAPDEVERVRVQKDCLKLFRNRVTEAGLLEPEQLDAIDREATGLVDEATARAKAAPPPSDPRAHRAAVMAAARRSRSSTSWRAVPNAPGSPRIGTGPASAESQRVSRSSARANSCRRRVPSRRNASDVPRA